MKRWSLAFFSGFLAISAASSYAASDSSQRLIPGNGPITEQQIRDKLTADGFSDIQVTSLGRAFQTTATRGGHVLRMAIDADSGSVLKTQDDDGDDD